MKVKIKSCSDENYWYKTEIGITYEVDTYNTDWYIVNIGLGLGSVLKTDAEIVDEEIRTHSILQDVLNTQKVSADAIAGNYVPGKDFMMHLGKDTMLREFPSGAKRDNNKGKIRPDLISPLMLKALGQVLAEGAEHYGERNWEKGIPQEVFKESASRHYLQWMNNETDEDHAAKLIFNVMGFIHNRDK